MQAIHLTGNYVTRTKSLICLQMFSHILNHLLLLMAGFGRTETYKPIIRMRTINPERSFIFLPLTFNICDHAGVAIAFFTDCNFDIEYSLETLCLYALWVRVTLRAPAG